MIRFREFLLEAKDFFPESEAEIKDKIRPKDVNDLIELYRTVQALMKEYQLGGSGLTIDPKNGTAKPEVYLSTVLEPYVTSADLDGWQKEYGFPNYKKKFSDGSTGITAAQWEMIICVAFNQLKSKNDNIDNSLKFMKFY